MLITLVNGNTPSCEAANKGSDLVVNIEKRMPRGR